MNDAAPIESLPAGAPHLRFRCGGELYALPLPAVREVVEASVMVRVPRAPACALGAMSHHGRVVSVVDLGALLGDRPPRPPTLVLLLDHPRRRLALGVDAVDGIGSLAAEGGLARHGDKAVTVLALDAILEQVDLAFARGGVVGSGSSSPPHRKET